MIMKTVLLVLLSILAQALAAQTNDFSPADFKLVLKHAKAGDFVNGG